MLFVLFQRVVSLQTLGVCVYASILYIALTFEKLDSSDERTVFSRLAVIFPKTKPQTEARPFKLSYPTYRNAKYVTAYV